MELPLQKDKDVNVITYCYSSHIQNAISARDQRLTTMVCRICLCYMLANLPMMGINISGKQHDWPTAWYICEVLYWTQYSMNFIIYAASNKQYRCEVGQAQYVVG